MNRKILSLLASLALVALSACGDDDSGPSGPNWKDRGLISWEKLSDGQGLWAMNAENAQAFLASASKDSMGVTQTELDLARYANSNSVTLRFTETVDTVSTRPIRTETTRWCVVSCTGDQCTAGDAEVWREVTTDPEGRLAIEPSDLPSGGFLSNQRIVFENEKIDEFWLYLPASKFFGEAEKFEVFKKR